MFYFFGEGPDTAVMHIHFGMSGRFRVSPLPAPDFTPTTRLQLLNEELGIAAHLSAMTVQHGDLGKIYFNIQGHFAPEFWHMVLKERFKLVLNTCTLLLHLRAPAMCPSQRWGLMTEAQVP